MQCIIGKGAVGLVGHNIAMIQPLHSTGPNIKNEKAFYVVVYIF